MTFLKREVLRKKPSLPVFGLVVAASVLFGGYVLFLAILAPEQLAEATTAATDLVCDKCVGTSDIADSAVTSVKIGSGQVKNSDLGNNAVTSGKIADGQVFGSDIASLTIGASDLADSAVTSSKLAGGAVVLQTHIVKGVGINIQPGAIGTEFVNCPADEIITGGGFTGDPQVDVFSNRPWDINTWRIDGINENTASIRSMVAWAECIGRAYP